MHAETTSSNATVEEYGLFGLATLPLMEQVHRLLHAIAMKYPYKETTSWKTLPMDNKRRILQYIKDNKPKTGGQAALQPSAQPPRDTTQDDDYDNEDEDKAGSAPSSILDERDESQPPNATLTIKPPTALSDPYLATLRTQVNQPGGSPKYQMTWKVKHVPKPLTFKCACGAVHRTATDNSVLDEVRVMMTTFGDVDTPCNATALLVQSIVQGQVKATLQSSSLKQYSLLARIHMLVDFTHLFQDEAMYYGRWKDFKSHTKDGDEGGPDDVELSDDLVDELDMFASYESMELNAFQLYFLERMKFADKRTQDMDTSTYLDFSK
ncbi:hypothetical protein H257_06646 [Aphanomyces astaci]|uniref:Uncharacterized protein n=1 Tax=Aphanomyces astaci TaxID=112090 RepID=W4GMT2_APHAT|nr:hypothetical protein H257_06646 [Aphanomyces astaci]ETV80334.1 hypothetical protein H257_06646 [Aphanomyces astaci]|eukprot:XP_009830258.1 hypothetical protein H257_06646 [Aphanomyces astaci]